MFHKTKNKNKKYFCKSCLQCFISKNVLNNHKELCLNINDAQYVRLEKGKIEFKNLFKQIPVSFKIYSDFAYKLVCIDDKFSKPIVLYRGENSAYRFIKVIFEEYEYCKKVMEKHFNKTLIMTEKEEEEFQSSNTCWICEKLKKLI